MDIVNRYVRIMLLVEAKKGGGKIATNKDFSSSFASEIHLADFGPLLPDSPPVVVRNCIKQMMDEGGVSVVMGTTGSQLVFKGIDKMLFGKKKVAVRKEMKSVPDSKEEVLVYAYEHCSLLTKEQIEYVTNDFWDYWTGRDWQRKVKTGYEPVKDWKATFRTYVRQPYTQEKLSKVTGTPKRDKSFV